MENFPVNILDIGVILILAVGGLIGLALGFVKAGLFVLSWLGSMMVTLMGFTTIQPYARNWIDTTWIADLAGGAVLFLATLIVLFLVSSIIGGWVRGSRLNALDRSLGMVAGLLTTALILSAGNIAAETMWPASQRPAWIQKARSMPLIQQGSNLLGRLISNNADIFNRRSGGGQLDAGKTLDPAAAVRRIIDPKPRNSAAPSGGGYDKKERRELDRLFQSRQ